MPETQQTARPSTSRGRRLGRRTRQTVLVVHIAAAGAWLGMDFAFAVLLCTALVTDDPGTAATAFQALELVAIWPMLTAGLTSLASGVTLGLGSKYGLLRYWWVAVKLAINLLFTSLIVFSLRPEVRAVADYGRQLVDDPAMKVPVGDLLYPLIIGPLLLLTAMVLSVFKPWGRIRKDRTAQPG